MRDLLSLVCLFTILIPTICFSSIENIENMKKLADGGNSYAQYEVGKWYFEHGNEQAAYNYYNMACGNGYNPACEDLNKNISKEIDKIDLDNMTFNDQFELGEKYFQEKNYAIAFKLFNSACNKGAIPAACLYLGRAYGFGQGVTRDPKKALEIFDRYYDYHDAFKLNKAALLEYAFGDKADNINKAMGIYNNLA